MAPEIQLEDHLCDNVLPLAAAGDTSAAEAALKARLSRKRTKTGCLTCRKRRIKCGEERPVCKNCIKSKRHCEGYNQRVVFKHPTYDYQPAPNGGAHITFQAGLVAGPPTALVSMQAPILDHSAYLQMQQQHGQPQTTAYDGHLQQWLVEEQPQQQHQQQLPPPMPNDYSQYPQFIHGLKPVTQPFQQPASAQYVDNIPQVSPAVPGPSPACDPSLGYVGQDQEYSHVIAQQQQVNAHGSQAMPPAALPADQVAEPHRPTMYGAFQYSHTSGTHPLTESEGTAWSHSRSTAAEHDATVPTPISDTSIRTTSFSQIPAMASHRHWPPIDYVPRPELARPIDFQEAPSQTSSQQRTSSVVSAPSQTQSWDNVTPELYEHDPHAVAYTTPNYILDAAAVEIQDDDYYDVERDDEIDVDTNLSAHNGDERQRKLSKILTMNQISVQDMHMRRYDTFIYAGILDQYRVEEAASPLKNPATARVFAHFISATGPSLSIFERHPRNTSVMFNKSSIPLSQQGLWTYTLPVAALRNQGLLHAMLALGSLHIARLQGASQTPSMQHYAWALKRIHSSVANPKSRGKVTTIAASMLLGFYEIMTADHMKWNTHLAGSKQLFVETDFVNMTKEFRRLKREKAERQQYGDIRRYSGEQPWLQDELLDQIPEVDERVVSHFVGREVRYDDHGSVQIPHVEIPPGLDLNKFEILKDLYWWYCKQDVIQSIVSGNPLLMDFSRWANCPPRAPLGRGDAVYGSFDHLVLLLGRIADFSSKDRERKLRQVEANGGHWGPAPNMKIPRPPQQAAAPPTPSSATNGFPPSATPPQAPPTNGMPQFYGMAPPPRANVQMPSSYMPAYSIPSPQSARPENSFDGDLSAQMQAALAEYGRIRAALHTFQTSLGKDFEPLSPDYQMPMMTSFGQALFYRSYDIGCLWALYNMAVIIAIRAHPHMPPAAHAAAAIAAQETAHFANEIGRIAAGIVPGPADQPLNPSLGAALCESCMPSFFAAVQYQNPRQRYDTVTRIWNIAKRTGWGSAELIANGCETAWVKAAESGRGPPYTRIARPSDNSDDPRLNGSWEKLDPNAQPNEIDDTDRRFVKTSANARLNWAIGVLGVEEDVQKFNIND